MDKESMAQVLSADPDFRVLRRFAPQEYYSREVPPPERLGQGVILDTETTGRDPAVDRIVELGMVRFTFDRESGMPCQVIRTYNSLEDPGMPIDPAASRVNGITDEMVKGQKIDDAKVEEMAQGLDLMIAHNSSFDREFCERRHPVFKHVRWACSRSQIDWEAEHIGGQKLDYIAFRLGFFYEAHRAEIDCLALLHVLAQPLPESKVPGLKKILEVFDRKDLRVWAVDAPYDRKNILAARKYRWGDGNNGKEKAWHIQIPESELDNEVTWLRSNVYGRPFRLVVDTVDALSRFSPRRVGTEVMRF